jgi:hypothetical protein
MELTEYEQWRKNLIMHYMKQGRVGQQKLAMLAPLLQMYDQKYADDQANRDRKQNERNAFLQQGMGLAGQLGGMYFMGKMMGGGAAAAPVAAGSASAVATPTLLSAKTVGAAPAASGASIGSVALPVAVGALALNNFWEGGGKDILRGRGDRADWTNSAFNTAPLTAAALLGPAAIPYAAAFPLANLGLRLLGKKSLGHYMKTGKSDAQLQRDDFRGKLKEKGIADKDYNVTLADGSKFNIGLDGKTKYTNIDGKTTRNAYDVDLNNPLAQHAIKRIDPYVAEMYANQMGIPREQYVGMLVNAATSNAKTPEEVDANIDTITGKKPATPPAQQPTQPPTQTQNQPNGTTKGPASLPAPTPAQPNPQNPIMAPPKLSVGDILRPQSPPSQPAPAPAPAQKVGFMSTPAAMPPTMPPAPTPPAPAPTPAPQTPFESPQQGLLALQQAIQNQSAGQSQLSTPAPSAPPNYGSIADLLRMMAQNGAIR